MSNHAGEHPSPLTPLRHLHKLSRSVTDVSVSATPKHHQSHHHHHFHRRDKEEKVPQSAGLTLQPSILQDWSKSEGVSPNGSRISSRRPSLLGSADEGAMASGLRLRKYTTEKEVAEETEKGILRAAELNKSLMELNSLSNDTTRRLDSTLYSLLEKNSSLQSTIASLRDLAIMTRRLNDEFKVESQDVVSDIETQLDGFEDFRDQQNKIESLQARILTGRQKVQLLGDRVEVVHHKVDDWEKLEGEWQEKTRQRIKILWAIIAAALLTIVGLLIFQYTATRTARLGVLNSGSIQELEGRLFNGTISLERTESHALDELRAVPEEPLDEDPRLKAFDEL